MNALMPGDYPIVPFDEPKRQLMQQEHMAALGQVPRDFDLNDWLHRIAVARALGIQIPFLNDLFQGQGQPINNDLIRSY